MLATLGFLTIGGFLLLTMTKRVSVLVALVLVPVVGAVAAGRAGDIGPMALDGITKVAPTGIMIAFAVLYFSLMIDAGLFEPLIRWILRAAKGDPVRIAVGTAVLTLCVALDGDGASTFLITVSAMLPVYRRIGMSRLVLAAIVCLAAGLMNMVPWGGPTARAAAALKLDTSDIVTPLLPAMGAGVLWVLIAAYLIGRRERNRLGALEDSPREEAGSTVGDGPGTPRVAERPHPALTVFNLTLTLALLVCLVLEAMPLPVLFVLAFVVALLVNHPRWEDQQAQLEKHGKNVVLVTTMIFAAGVFTGLLTGTGMIERMASALVGVVPDALGGHLPVVVAVTSMPLSLVFTPDAYYFGILPVLAQTADSFGTGQAEIARAAVLGQMTTGFPLSPLTAATFILIGMTGVQLGEHQRFVFRWAFATTLVMTAAALLTGALPL
ncbi:TRAP transporter large permease subunit [Streptomyces ferrugineus]|uniref:TRAP transporter large permease subunit n=1 Tax=Streptomyces ferrugineus TaxID=1413221 RepID=A0A7M2SZK6_9ACTN|nr:citrate:proton symporter [Streptomyces ferrugineus]QOV41309.1 TRAP transporter large permease subunit [Streptomyces ferrugineus]